MLDDALIVNYKFYFIRSYYYLSKFSFEILTMAFTEALKPKGKKHLSTLVDADGRLVEAETRNDELQKIKCDEIIQILISAGYYRAKIKGLSEFDKVVGGMCWCIEICNVDLDVDLLFQENSTIGQKIALTEKIVAVLPKMQCPHSIEPHQIQGLDFIHIYPVVEWLVKRSNENRYERGDYLRSYAVHQFNKHYEFPGEKYDPELIEKMIVNIKNLQGSYGPQRKFKRITTDDQPKDQISEIERTLFEYGHTPYKIEGGVSGDEQVEIANEARFEELSKIMTSVPEDTRLGANTVTTLVSKRASEVSAVIEKFSKMEVNDDGVDELNRCRTLESELEEKKKNLELEVQKAEEKYNILIASVDADSSADIKIPEDKIDDVNKLETIIESNERLKAKEELFKEKCELELEKIHGMLRDFESSHQALQSAPELEKEYNSLMTELSESRLRLAKASRAAASVQRLIDQVPTRAELSQYQKRFLELYNQVAAKHRETKQYYTLYNSLNDQRQYLTKEVNLLNSILDSYNKAMQSPIAKEEFMSQFEAIVDGIKQNKAKVEMMRNETRESKEKLRLQLQGLLDQQRQYAAALKEFTAECKLTFTS